MKTSKQRELIGDMVDKHKIRLVKTASGDSVYFVTIKAAAALSNEGIAVDAGHVTDFPDYNFVGLTWKRLSQQELLRIYESPEAVQQAMSKALELTKAQPGIESAMKRIAPAQGMGAAR